MTKQPTDGATMYITLKKYLADLVDLESSKPENQRRYVPTMAELAEDIGISTTAISNIATNRISQMSLETGGKIIAAMRARKFPMEVSDLLAYRPAIDENE